MKKYLKRLLSTFLATILILGSVQVFSFPALSASPPATPQNFKVYAASSNSIKVSWSAVKLASGYVVYRYNSAKKAFERIKVTKSTSFMNTKLTAGKTYYYKVRAYRTISGKNIYGNPSAAKTLTLKKIVTTTKKPTMTSVISENIQIWYSNPIICDNKVKIDINDVYLKIVDKHTLEMCISYVVVSAENLTSGNGNFRAFAFDANDEPTNTCTIHMFDKPYVGQQYQEKCLIRATASDPSETIRKIVISDIMLPKE